VLQVVGIIDEAALIDAQGPDVLHGGVDTHDWKSEGAVVVLDCRVLLKHAGHVLAKGNVITQQFDILVGESDKRSGFIAAGLLRGASGENADGRRTKGLKNVLDCGSESVSIRQQQDYGSDTPCHSSHGEQGPPQIVAHGGKRLLQQVPRHRRRRQFRNNATRGFLSLARRFNQGYG